MQSHTADSENVNASCRSDRNYVAGPLSFEVRNFERIADKNYIEKVINYLVNERPIIAIASTDGQTYGDSVLIESGDETLTVDLPRSFANRNTGEVRIYFQDKDKAWIFFETHINYSTTYTMNINYPESMCLHRNRRHQRINAPAGTTAFFLQNDANCYGGLVKNLSQTGMLVCTRNKQRPPSQDNVLTEISIILPRKISSPEDFQSGKAVFLPMIRKGKIVRSNQEQGADWVCYGIEFEYSSIEVEKELAAYPSPRKDLEEVY